MEIQTIIYMFNYTFGPRILTNSRNWLCLFQIEQSCLYTTIFCNFRPNPHFALQKC